jgi:hypothetical protein
MQRNLAAAAPFCPCAVLPTLDEFRFRELAPRRASHYRVAKQRRVQVLSK